MHGAPPSEAFGTQRNATVQFRAEKSDTQFDHESFGGEASPVCVDGTNSCRQNCDDESHAIVYKPYSVSWDIPVEQGFAILLV
jgi:hypothetical protein